MEKRRRLSFTGIIYTIFIIGTIVSISIVYRDLDSRIAYNFVVGYVFLAFFIVIYTIITSFKSFITFLKGLRERWK